MIVVMKKNNLIFVAIIFLLSLAFYGINSALVKGDQIDYTSPVTVESGNFGEGKTVMLDPGHGGEDPGAVSDFNGIKEKDINLFIALETKKHLEADGYKVIMTRSEDVLVFDDTANGITQKRKQDLLRRKKMMDEGGADIVVSIHLNKFTQEKQKGAQVFFAKNSKSSEKLAICLQDMIKSQIDSANKREAIEKKEEIIILKNLKTTTAIVECGFLSNKEEEQKLADKAYQEKLAKSIKDGIDKYFGK